LLDGEPGVSAAEIEAEGGRELLPPQAPSAPATSGSKSRRHPRPSATANHSAAGRVGHRLRAGTVRVPGAADRKRR
jgi:hypothetical protein